MKKNSRKGKHDFISIEAARFWSLAVLFVWLHFVGCRETEIRPAEITSHDMCSYCRMAISESRYAAQFVQDDGESVKFDDIGCMLQFLKSKRNRPGTKHFFVMDYKSRVWMGAEQSYFVRSEEFETPMSYGIVAFKNSEGAEAAAGKSEGTLIDFAALLAGEMKEE